MQEYGPSADVFTEVLRHLKTTSDHRDEFKRFIHSYCGINDALQLCLRTLDKLLHSDDGTSVASRGLCQVYVDIVSAVTSSLKTDVICELREMNTAAKEKLSKMEQDINNQSKEVISTVAELEKCCSTFDKLQGESKSLHARALDRRVSAAPRSIWSPSTNDKDKVFGKLQRIESDRERIARDAEDLYGSILSKHTSSYSKLSHSLSELASMRRRMNRRLVSELRSTGERLNRTVVDVVQSSCNRMVDVVSINIPSEGDFKMNLPSVEQSMLKLVGIDTESRIKDMRGKVSEVSFIEYRAIQTYIAKEQGEISFTRNERIDVIRPDASGWWTGRNERGETGIFPCVLVVERPAGAPLPQIHQSVNGSIRSDAEVRHSRNALSHRPHLLRERQNINGSPTIDSGWKSTESMDERIPMIRSRAPGKFCAVAHFPFYSDSIYLEAGDWVKVDTVCNNNKFVIARNSRGQCGRVPLNMLTVKEDKENSENSIINW